MWSVDIKCALEPRVHWKRGWSRQKRVSKEKEQRKRGIWIVYIFIIFRRRFGRGGSSQRFTNRTRICLRRKAWIAHARGTSHSDERSCRTRGTRRQARASCLHNLFSKFRSPRNQGSRRDPFLPSFLPTYYTHAVLPVFLLFLSALLSSFQPPL